ncbi:hypothetical protein [Alicyclobacillus macrosporangiidus]|uniref:hypothetical protein n=1 Tax=Alicyclobacillus macrosporangiidus TaxID=392015 RepID=UPI0012DC1DE3|nr:hypothetical protein [Alicyclobacillus macrosporangiidus]
MNSDTQFIPKELKTFLHSNFGTVARIEPLSGVAGEGGANRLTFEDGRSVIVKSSPLPRERSFYEHHAGHVKRAGVGVPQLYWSGADDSGNNWIVLEDVLHPFPKERWVCDAEQIEMLFRLHSSTWGSERPKLDTAAYRPSWNEEMTHQACEWFSDKEERSQVERGLIEVQLHARFLFQPLCCLSADPNPTNWRVRRNGELVLTDRERFCYGHPSIDLAITMPGLGRKNGTTEAKIAALYRTCWERNRGSVPTELGDLERWMQVAKIWSAVEFIASATLNPALYPEGTILYIVRELPGFLEQFV